MESDDANLVNGNSPHPHEGDLPEKNRSSQSAAWLQGRKSTRMSGTRMSGTRLTSRCVSGTCSWLGSGPGCLLQVLTKLASNSNPVAHAAAETSTDPGLSSLVDEITSQEEWTGKGGYQLSMMLERERERERQRERERERETERERERERERESERARVAHV